MRSELTHPRFSKFIQPATEELNSCPPRSGRSGKVPPHRLISGVS